MTAIASADCAQCHSALAADQEWCHECGRSRTTLFRPPDWRIGAAIVAGVVALAAAATVFALSRVSHSADRSAAAATTAAPARSASAGTSSTAKLLSWPAGLGGWTVVLSSSKSESTARTSATDLGGTVSDLGLLDSSQHPSMNPGHWVVFAGRFPTRAEAQSAAASLVAQGHTSAHARMVEPPGGN